MSEPTYAEPIPDTFEEFFDTKIILEALKTFISENTKKDDYYEYAQKPVDYIDDFFLDERRKLDTMFEPQKSYFMKV